MSKLYANQWLRCLFGFNYAKWLETKACSRGILRRPCVCKNSRGFTFEIADPARNQQRDRAEPGSSRYDAACRYSYKSPPRDRAAPALFCDRRPPRDQSTSSRGNAVSPPARAAAAMTPPAASQSENDLQQLPTDPPPPRRFPRSFAPSAI